MKKINCLCSTLVIALILRGTFLQSVCGPCECLTDTIYNGVKVVCTGRNLFGAPRSIPSNTTTLVMDGSALFLLQDEFTEMNQLKYLDVAVSELSVLDEHFFIGLSHLEVLRLHYDIPYIENEFDLVFLKPLVHLQFFFLTNSFTESYSCSSCPVSLQSLYIDCWNCTFDSSFLKLKNLSSLSFASLWCKELLLDNSSFQHMPYLETLNFTHCSVNYVRPGYLDPLKNLRILDLSMYGGFAAFVAASPSLSFIPIEYIRFTNWKKTEIDADDFSYLQNTSLRELHIVFEARNLTLHIESLAKLPKSLESFTLTNAHDVSFEYQPMLKSLDLSNFVDFFTKENFRLQLLPPSLEIFTCGNCSCQRFLDFVQGKAMVKLNMKQLILPGSGIDEFDPRVLNILPMIEYIDLQDNNLTSLPTFPSNNSITYLNVAGNSLQHVLANKDSFESLSKLLTIDLSQNSISALATNIFNDLQRVKVINLSNNDLWTVNVKLVHLTDLEVLDLRSNRIHAVGETTRNDIAQLPNTRVILDENPLVCRCDELESLLWMNRNEKRVHNLPSLRCILSTGEYETLDKIDEIITNLQAQCILESDDNVVEISVSVCVTISVLTVILVVLGYHHRWKLRYLYFAGRRGYRRRYNREQVNNEEYEFDAFISYATPDRRFVIDEMRKELEGKHGLKLCIHHRDFLPGEVISDNIINAIQNSRTTVVVLSPAFLESTWCEFEFNMARMEGVSRRQDIVVMVLYEHVPVMNLSKDMAMMLKHNSYVEYNHELFNRKMFWSNIKESIQTSRPRD